MPNRKDLKWNLRKTNGWKNYKKMTEDNDKLHMAASYGKRNKQSETQKFWESEDWLKKQSNTESWKLYSR